MQALPTVHTSLAQNIFRILLGSALVFAGISHLTFARTEFQAQVPDWVPMDTDLVVVLSGIAEIAIGLSLLFGGKYKAYIGLGTALFFIMVFPGNISQYINKRDGFGLDTDAARFGRLFFQPVLVVWALWSTGAWSTLMEMRRLKK